MRVPPEDRIDAGSVDRSVEKPASEYSSTAELDRWTRSPNSELTKLVSGLVQMQTDVLKDQAQRKADERERKVEEKRKAAEEAATSSAPFTLAPKKSDSKYQRIQAEGMRSAPGCPSESDLDRGCVFWMSATQLSLIHI